MWTFSKCKHPAKYLHVKKDHTTKHNHDHSVITYHLYCLSCNEDVDISYAVLNEEQIRADYCMSKE